MRDIRFCLAIVLCILSIPAMAQSPSLPEQQQKFLSIIDDFAEKYKSAKNEMAQGALRVQRANAICDLFKGPNVKEQ